MNRLAILMTVGFACGATAIRASHCELFTVGVHLQVDPSITSPVILAGLKAETERLWEPYGVRLDWTDSGCREAAPHALSLQVMLQRTEPPNQADGATVLGRAPLLLNGPRVRPILLSFDATKKVLALRTNASTSSVVVVQNDDLARALGRVLAHEIGHVLLSAPVHEEEGLMRAVFRTDQLADVDARQFRLTSLSVARLRNRIRVLTDVEHRDAGRAACDGSKAVQ